METHLKWEREKEAHKAGKRIQFLGSSDIWTTCFPAPLWQECHQYRIHPDDDAPPVQTEEKPKDACKSGTWEHDEGFKTEEKPATVPHLRWHRLSELTRDDVGTIELLAATSVDGIGCIARWSRLEEGGWEVSAMDTEGDSGMVPITDFTEEAVPPEPPTIFDDLASTEVVPATVPLAVAEKLRQELQNIADAKPSTWGDMQDQFQPWAQNRARAAIAAFQASTK